MTLKSAALFALIGMILLTVLLAVGFIRDVVSLAAGVVAVVPVLISLIHLLASLGLTVFLYVFHNAQS
ncbi:MAG: hypothetical protein ABSE21_04000 [Bryobacteraceae bacterium]|jgi:hypothetical protein